MVTPRIATILAGLSGQVEIQKGPQGDFAEADEVELVIRTKDEDKHVTSARALVVGIPCFVESQLAFLPDYLKEEVIQDVSTIFKYFREKLDNWDASTQVINATKPSIVDYVIELYNAPRGPVATVDSKFSQPFNRAEAMQMTLIRATRQTISALERDEAIRLMVLLDVGLRMWSHKKPSKMLYISGASVYNRPNWTRFCEIGTQIGWEQAGQLFTESFEEFLKSK
jgi:hypothetical protein